MKGYNCNLNFYFFEISNFCILSLSLLLEITALSLSLSSFLGYVFFLYPSLSLQIC